MSADITVDMAADNPYSAPDAELDNGSGELYSPKILSFNGRIGRLRYLAYGVGSSFLFILAMIPLGAASAIMGGETGPSGIGMIGIGVLYIAMIVVSVMFGKRRLNDLNRGGWWLLLFLVPIVNLLLSIYMVFFPGSEGDNNFGSAPQANSIGVLILGWMMPALFILGIVAAIAVPQFAGMTQ
ncbi:MAG: DUF805 domain-containing protein [Gammaproteobacteria bacterium]|nr:DUF805 domain-containing protein [Gammaproteobacteria bacterium]